jgi:hypothetical protein
VVLNTLRKKGLGKVHMGGRGLHRGWWWPVGPKLVFDQMAAPVPEIMDVCGTYLMLISGGDISVSDAYCSYRILLHFTTNLLIT